MSMQRLEQALLRLEGQLGGFPVQLRDTEIRYIHVHRPRLQLECRPPEKPVDWRSETIFWRSATVGVALVLALQTALVLLSWWVTS